MRKKYTINGEARAVIIVLGKYLSDDGEPTHELKERLCKGLELYGRRRSVLLVSGGRVNEKAPCSEAEAMAKYLVGRGVPREDIITEAASRNTYENARNCAELLSDAEFSEVYLVTSAKHIYRAYFNPIRFFRLNFGLPVKAAPSCDCNVTCYGYQEGRENVLVLYGGERELSQYLASHGEQNVFAKKKRGLIRRGFVPVVARRSEEIAEEMSKIYGAVRVEII